MARANVVLMLLLLLLLLLLVLLLLFAVTERDVSRTDRNNTFFSGNDNPGLTLLHDVLMTYCMYNFDLGVFLQPARANSPD